MSFFARFSALFVASLLMLSPTVASAYLQCVPFARAESGIEIRGNAETWWHQAAGKYERGREPRVGAVMAMPGTRAMPLGHVAVVTQVVSDREILISHSNWSPINGRRGQIERNVRAVDVSAAGDWSQVRIWYRPIGDLGLRANPVSGFIYPDGSASGRTQPNLAPVFGPEWTPGNGLGAVIATIDAN
jgi:surface antigen